MKKVTQQSDDMLLDFLDGKLSNEQQAIVKDSLHKDLALQERLEQLRLIHDQLSFARLEVPSKNFTTSVMGKLDHYKVQHGLSIRNGLFLLAGILAILSVGVTLLSAGVFDQTTTVDLNNVGLAQRFIKQSLPSISIDGKILVNTIILLNLVIAFIVLDRAVLKPFFQRRMENA
jgi:F0F1-type ATP synthase membrane subunit c/vacuolar-type H+-ATPase subunit K